MLEVLPIQSKEEQETVCSRCAVPYHADDMAYKALIDGELIGVCQFTMNQKGGYIHNLSIIKDKEISSKDRAEALFVMGRATLNFIDLCGVHYAIFAGKDTDEGLLRAIGFKKNDEGVYDINLEGFFTDHCHEH